MKKNKLVYLIVATLLFTSCGSESDATAVAQSSAMDSGEYGTSESFESDYYLTEESATQEAPTEDGTPYDEGLDVNATEYKREAMFAKEGYIENIIEEKKEDKTKVFEETILQVESLVGSYNGYFETAQYSDYNGKYFNSTIKVPVKDFQNLYNDLKDLGVNFYNESNVVNETSGYYSLKSRIEVKKLSKERLEELIDTTSSSKDLLKLYDSYFDLVAEIETMEATLSQIESATSYSTIHYSLSDGSTEHDFEDESFGTKLKVGFGTSIDFVEVLLLGLAYISIPLIIFTFIVFFVYKKFKVLFKKLIKELIKIEKDEEITSLIDEVKENKENKEDLEDKK